jgi:4-hydroxythreonine-4-phosphate dehydrogenase
MLHPPNKLPLLAFTLGDVAGIGPEIIVRGWAGLCDLCRPVVAGDAAILRRAMELVHGNRVRLHQLTTPEEAMGQADQVEFVQVSTADLASVAPGTIDARAGQAAYDFLLWSIDQALARRIDGIVTAPLHKESLAAAGIRHPGHTEILAERTGSRQFAMVLAIEGLAVIHQTLHMALRDVFKHLDPVSIAEKAVLLQTLLKDLGVAAPRLGLAALNPHAGEHGLFGDEEEIILRPLANRLRDQGINIQGPIPADTLFQRAVAGEFDGIVALYHDQGHIALKLAGRGRAVNISAGLPIVRTSVAHGTAFDIAWQGKADAESLLTATRYATGLARARNLVGPAW